MNFFDSLMAPLSREHCMIIFYLGIINLFFAYSTFKKYDTTHTTINGAIIIESN